MPTRARLDSRRRGYLVLQVSSEGRLQVLLVTILRNRRINSHRTSNRRINSHRISNLPTSSPRRTSSRGRRMLILVLAAGTLVLLTMVDSPLLPITPPV